MTLAIVASADGRITNPRRVGDRTWISAEDQRFFAKRMAASDAVIMGSGTYRAHRAHMRKTPRIRRIVMTSTPQKFTRDARQDWLEFTALSPARLLGKLKREGAERILLVSGPRLSGAFLRTGKVAKIFLTLEPVLFGGGLPILEGDFPLKKLRLLQVRRLNKGGTLLLEYALRSKIRSEFLENPFERGKHGGKLG